MANRGEARGAACCGGPVGEGGVADLNIEEIGVADLGGNCKAAADVEATF